MRRIEYIYIINQPDNIEKRIELMKAFNEGKQLQYRAIPSGWIDCNEPEIIFGNLKRVRIAL